MAEQTERILIVDDDDGFRRLLSNLLSHRFKVEPVASLDAARSALGRQLFQGVLLDVRLGGTASADTDGIVLLKEIKQERPLLPVLVMTGFGDVRTAVEAMKFGADDFIEKGEVDPAGLAKRLREILALSRSRLRVEAEAAQHRQLDPSNLVGSSRSMEPLRTRIEMAANDGYSSVLVLGETGTGKEVVARAIHEQGWRHEGPFVAVPMAGLNPMLLESELFGHEKGAFTGAVQSHAGYIERAQGGVLFLDEIGDLSLELQMKLLRFLEPSHEQKDAESGHRLVFRVGSTRGVPVDVQVIAATHRPLKEYVAKEQFRRDLYFRLNTIEITVPPLRERREDIPLLADHFLHLLRKQGRTKLAGFSNTAIDGLQQYAWPGNVRQLRGVVEWAVLAAMQAGHWAVERDDLPSELNPKGGGDLDSKVLAEESGPLAVERAKAAAELECIERALAQTDGRKSDAQELLGYSNRQTMRRRVQQLRERFPDLWLKFPKVADAYDRTGE